MSPLGGSWALAPAFAEWLLEHLGIPAGQHAAIAALVALSSTVAAIIRIWNGRDATVPRYDARRS